MRSRAAGKPTHWSARKPTMKSRVASVGQGHIMPATAAWRPPPQRHWAKIHVGFDAALTHDMLAWFVEAWCGDRLKSRTYFASEGEAVKYAVRLQ